MRYFVLIVLCLFSHQLFSQVVALQNDRENIVYLCLPNPLTIAVSSCSPNEVIVRTDNGQLQKEDEDGRYNYLPERVGNAKIFIEKLVDGKRLLVGEKVMRVHRMDIVAVFGHLTGQASKLEIYNSRYIYTYVRGLSIDARFPLKGFNVSVSRNGAKVYDHYTASKGELDDETINFFARLQNGDKVVLNKISVTDCDKSSRELDSIEVKVTNAEDFKRPTPRTEYYEDPITGDAVKREVR